MQRRNSVPSLAQAASPPTKRLQRRNSTPALPDAEQSLEKTSPKPKFFKSRTSSLLTGGILAGAPGNALRRAFKRIGKKSQQADVASMDDEHEEEEAETDLRKEQSKRIQKLYKQPSQLSLPVWRDLQAPPAAVHESDFAADTCEVGMVRLVYSKIRSLRESKDYVNVYKRNSWKDLVGDLRHGIRVCLKVQGFVNLLLDGCESKTDSSWAVNPSLEKQRVWMELLNYLGDPKSADGKISAKELEEYRAMIKASALAEEKRVVVEATPEEWMAAKSTATHIASPTDFPSLLPRPPNTAPPARCSPVLSKRAMVCQHGADDSDDTKLSPPV